MSSGWKDIRVDGYRLHPLTSIRQDDVAEFVGDGVGVYICNYPEPAWYRRFGFTRTRSFSVDKKREMFRRMNHASYWLSPTYDLYLDGDTFDWAHDQVLHIGYGRLRGRPAQLYQTFQLMRWLVRHRSDLDYCLVYNFDLPYFAAAMFAKYVLRKRLVVDYEDDYVAVRRSRFKNALTRIIRRTTDAAICVNESMVDVFDPDVATCVMNGFADLSYAETLDFSLQDDGVYLYSGQLDEIRGADLIPSLVTELRKHVSGSKVVVTGRGPLEEEVNGWSIPEVEYVGFLADDEYDKLLRDVDACLVLQKPDHPFSRGSFPSKIEAYARYKKPILVLTEAHDLVRPRTELEEP